MAEAVWIAWKTLPAKISASARDRLQVHCWYLAHFQLAVCLLQGVRADTVLHKPSKYQQPIQASSGTARRVLSHGD